VGIGAGIGVGIGVGFGVGLGVGGGGGGLTLTEDGVTDVKVVVFSPAPMPLLAANEYVNVPTGRSMPRAKATPVS